MIFLARRNKKSHFYALFDSKVHVGNHTYQSVATRALWLEAKVVLTEFGVSTKAGHKAEKEFERLRQAAINFGLQTLPNWNDYLLRFPGRGIYDQPLLRGDYSRIPPATPCMDTMEYRVFHPWMYR